jgi:hypothetical protein
MKEVVAKVQMYVGTRADGSGVTEMVFHPEQDAVIFRDKDGNEIRLDPQRMSTMVKELSAFTALLERIGVKTK